MKRAMVEQLADIVVMAQALDGVGDHLLGILPGDQGGTADPQVMVAVMVERRHHRAAPRQGLDQQLRTGVALVEPGEVFAQRGLSISWKRPMYSAECVQGLKVMVLTISLSRV
jgi:hypothetical protein